MVFVVGERRCSRPVYASKYNTRERERGGAPKASPAGARRPTARGASVAAATAAAVQAGSASCGPATAYSVLLVLMLVLLLEGGFARDLQAPLVASLDI